MADHSQGEAPSTSSTKARLAKALEEIDERPLAERARRGEFDDYESWHAFPLMTLITALKHRGGRRCREMIRRIASGEFDATSEEAEAWRRSPEGQAAFDSLGLS